MDGPGGAAVVVATHNRGPSLMRLLDTLAVQHGVDHFEVVIVDDGSTDDTPGLLARRPLDAAFTRRVVRREHNRGPATARNVGWRATTAALVCFTDDDCQPTPGWLGTLCGRLASASVVQGKTVADPAQVHRWGPWSHTVEILEEAGFYETCNMGYQRQVLEGLGGFDEAFRAPYGEDTDLAWRAREAGFSTAFSEDAVVHHDVSPSSWPAYVRDLRRREALVRVVAAHPGLRTCFPGRWYTRKTHPAVLAATGSLGVLAARRRRLGSWLVAALTTWRYYQAVRTTRPGPRRRYGWPALLPMAMAADLVEIFVLARASWRLRTFLI